MDIEGFKNRVYKRTNIRNSLIAFCILIPLMIMLIILLALGSDYDGLLRSVAVILGLLLLAIMFKIYYNFFLFKIDENDTKIELKANNVEIKFKLYDQFYGKYGAKSFGLVIKIKVNAKTMKILYPFTEDVRFGVKKEDWNQKNETLKKLNQIKQIDVIYLKKSKVIINKIVAVDNIIRKIK